MKDGYEKPRMEVLEIACGDVMATSGQEFKQGVECFNVDDAPATA